MGDQTMQEQTPPSEKVRTTLQESFRAWHERERAEAYGFLRRMLARQAERRFGAKAGVSVASLLAAIHDSDRFEEVAIGSSSARSPATCLSAWKD